jgi:DHA2 family multidrug resistance protein-like MFS transporter
MSTLAMPAAGHAPGKLVGNDRLLAGLVLGVLSFWLFAQSVLNIAPDMRRDLGLDAGTMNTAVALTSLFAGIFVVVMGGLADRVGRLRITRIGFGLSIAGSLLVAVTPAGGLATPVLLSGRVLQGLAAACILPATLALVKAGWDGAGRQRAISMWSIGTWGGAGLCSLVGGLMSQNFGWRSIFWAAIAVCIGGLWLIRGTPESRAPARAGSRFDLPGVLAFMVAMLGLQVLVTRGAALGWGTPLVAALLAITLAAGAAFLFVENRSPHAFFDFSLFRNRTYAGATLSNFLLNGAAGTLVVSLQLVQTGGGMNAQQAGLLTLGYAAAIIGFIRVGEKLLQRFGPRRPMVWGCAITALGIVALMPTHLPLARYQVLAMVGYALFGMGLAFYATPSTDAALSNLPAAQGGSGAGIYKMASSLGAAFGVAISAAVFTALSADGGGVNWLEGVITFSGRQDNLALREAAFVALACNVAMVLLAMVAVLVAVPGGRPRESSD